MTSKKLQTRVYRTFAKILAKKAVGFAVTAVLMTLVIGTLVGILWLYTEATDLIIQTTAIDDKPWWHMSVTISLIIISVITIRGLGKSWAEAKIEVGKSD